MYENQKNEFFILQSAYALLTVLPQNLNSWSILMLFTWRSPNEKLISIPTILWTHTHLMWAQHKISKERGKEIKVLYLNRLALMHDLQTSIKSLVYT